MSSIETQQYLKAILRDRANARNMSSSYYETAFVIPHMQTSAMPHRPRQPAPASQPGAGAMASESTLVDKDGVPVVSKDKNDAASALNGPSSHGKSLFKRLLRKA